MIRTPRIVALVSLVAMIALVSLASALAIGCGRSGPQRSVVVRVSDGTGELRVEPANILFAKRARGVRGSIELVVRAGQSMTISAPGACAVAVAPDVSEAALRAVIEMPSDLPAVGWDADFSVSAQAMCDEARRGRMEWRVVEGALHAFEIVDGGFSLRGRTGAQPMPVQERPWGIVPVSPRTRGTTVIEARWSDAAGNALSKTVRVSSAPRASGVPSIAVDQTVHLGGRGWRLLRTTPVDAKPELDAVEPDLFRFRARRPGQFVLLDERDRPLSIRAGLHERVPLDCGRSECHRAATEDAQASPMTHVLRNGLEGALGSSYEPACAIACHAAGEPGLDDGGFVALAAKLGFELPAPHAGAWDELPRALRRLGGVGCTSCHGPAAIPEPTARFAILRADVCATCHDAPPRYSHVAAWRTSAMAQSDRDPIAASDPLCQRCHTTAGFLRTLSTAPREDAPREAGPVGIACAACHAPHAAHGASLVREVAVTPAFAALPAKDRICVPCHESGAAAVWAGGVGTTSPHASIGCTGCHMTGRAGDTDRGSAHSFRVDYAACRTCHTQGLPAPRDPTRALVPEAMRGATAHAARMRESKPDGPHAIGIRALAEDRAALIHNSRYVSAVFGAWLLERGL